MTSEYNNLKGHSLLIVESEYLAGEIGAQCYVNGEMRFVDFQNNVPKNLTQYLIDKDIDIALIHTASLSDKEEVINANRNGKKIVIIKRDPPATYEEMDMYKCFENEGIVTIPKCLGIAEKSVGLLNKILQEK